MNRRLKDLRSELGLTQQEFADKLGTKRTNIGKYESGISAPSDAVISLICKENWSGKTVNEEWLRTGEGEMFNKLDREQEIAAMTAMLFKEEESSFKYRLIAALSKMDDSGWKALEQLAKEIANKND